jgi:hypothetical protein
MVEHPILFSAPMVQAILEGRKTQTRRIVKPAKSQSWATPDFFKNVTSHRLYDGFLALEHPEGGPGGCIRVPWRASDRLWVRETWARREYSKKIYYRATPELGAMFNREGDRWRPSIYMPRAASRITLEIMSVRVERLQDISEEDARAEGAPPNHPSIDAISREFGFKDFSRSWFAQLWESINGAGSWDANPFVWVVEFKKLEALKGAA